MPPSSSALDASAQQSLKDVQLVVSLYDTNQDGELSDDEVAKIKEDYRRKQGPGYEVVRQRYMEQRRQQSNLRPGGRADEAREGEEEELPDFVVQMLRDDVQFHGTAMRYLALTGACARAIKYLRVAFRPIAHPRIIQASFLISWLYIFGDVGMQVYHMRAHCDASDQALLLGGLKRFAFHATASIALPAYTIPRVVQLSRAMVFKRMGGRWLTIGPPCAALCVVPLLPTVFDRPVSALCDAVFDRAIVRSASPRPQ